MDPSQPDRHERILGSAATYTQQQLAENSGVTLERTQEMWSALGFAAPEPDDVAFGEADLVALRLVSSLRDAGVIDDGSELALTRSLGQSMARLAEWQLDIVRDYLTEIGGDEQLDSGTVASALIGPMEHLQQYVWRRHLLAVANRKGLDASSADTAVAVGFADIVGFTGMSRTLGQAELARYVDAFEASAAAVVARHGGRVVKMIGDEVMFAVDETTAAAEIGLELAARRRSEDDAPDVRVGVAYGPVVQQLGDLYGSVVNIAARLTALARPGTVLVDRVLGKQMREQPGYSVRRIGRVSVSGFEHLQPWVLSRRTQRERPAREPDESR